MKDELKFDDGKIRMDLIDWGIMDALGRVLTYGLKKGYKEDSWKQLDPKRIKPALLRHLSSYFQGSVTDKESGLHEFDHIAFNIMALCYFKKIGLIE